MATVYSRFTKPADAEPVVREREPELLDLELPVRSMYDSSWALAQGLLVIEGAPLDPLPGEGRLPD